MWRLSVISECTPSIPSLTIGGSAVESTKSLGVHITEDLSWTHSTASLAKNAKRASTTPANWEERGPQLPIMCSFNRGTAESILTSCLTGWFGNSFATNHRSLQQDKSAREITGASLSSLLDLYNTHQACQAISIVCPPTFHTTFPVPCLQGEGPGASMTPPADWETALSNRLSGYWTPFPLYQLPLLKKTHTHTHSSHFTLHKEYYCISCTDTATSF